MKIHAIKLTKVGSRIMLRSPLCGRSYSDAPMAENPVDATCGWCKKILAKEATK